MLREHVIAVKNIKRIFYIAITIVSFIFAYVIRSSLYIAGASTFHLNDVIYLLLPISIIWWFALNKNEMYSSRRFEPFISQFGKIFRSVAIGMIVLFAMITVFKLPVPSRLFLGIFAGINILLLTFSNYLEYWLSNIIRSKGYNIRNVIVVGEEKKSSQLISAITENPGWGIHVHGVVVLDKIPYKYNKDNKWTKSDVMGYPVLGKLKDFKSIVNDRPVDFVFFAVPPRHLRKIQPHINYLVERGITPRVTANFFYRMGFIKPSIDEIGDMSFFSFNTVNHSFYHIMIKEIADRFAAFLGLVLLSPLFVLVSIAIKLNSRGPVFFKQKRVGKNGRLFNIYKFRSMFIDAEERRKELEAHNEVSGPVFKMENDPRVTSVGDFIRKTSIDELPQLINVLKGDMSLVGPRPPLPSEVTQYNNWQRRRLSMKPGITCTWQVSGRSNIDFETWMKMDLEYIDKWNIYKDAKLLLKTMPAVLFRKGAK